MKHHANAAIFVPHAGCPHQCSFCDQKAISGTAELPTPGSVTQLLQKASKSLGERIRSAQIAFFGGSFTAIPREYRISLLRAAQPFCGKGGFSGIRISTRPDCITPAILKELVAFNVTAIELGAQSMDCAVLTANKRGHTPEQVEHASRLIKQAGISLGLQMMVGLYGEDAQSSHCTAERLAQLKPDTMRIYPTLVMMGTYLEALYHSGEYTPLALEAAVDICARLLELFQQRNIPVIRMGLHDTPDLQRGFVAGPYHPAFRELCESKLMLGRAINALKSAEISSGEVHLHVDPRDISRMIGQNRRNHTALEQLGYKVRVVGDAVVEPFTVKVVKAMDLVPVFNNV